VDRFEFQSSSTWGIPEFSNYPIEPLTVSPEDFLQSVEETIDRTGSWQAKTEYRMGGGTTVTITPSTSGDPITYLALATWGSLEASGRYDSIEHALRGLPLISRSLFYVRDEGGWAGLVGG
jgi:hypothetical protein